MAGLQESTADGKAPAEASSDLAVPLIGLALGMLLAVLDQTIVATALPRIAGDLGSFQNVSWVVTGYLLTSTASTPVYGKLGDLYGRKRMYIIAVTIFIVASALAGLSQNMGELIATRVLQGLGGGGLMSLAIAAVGDLVPPRERGRYEGYFGGVFALGSLGGPLAGGFLTDHLSWRWVFYINLPIGLAALAITATRFRAPARRERGSVDYTGAALLVGAVTCLLLATVWGGRTYDWGSWEIIGLLAAAAVLLAGFLFWETGAEFPILPLHLFGSRAFSTVIPASVLLGATLFGAVVYLPQFFQVVHGMSPSTSGLMLVPLMLTAVVGSFVVGKWMTERGTYKGFLIAGAACLLVGCVLLTRLERHTPLWEPSLYMVVLGLGIGFIMPTLVLLAQNAVRQKDIGVATSSATFFRSLGGAVGTSIFGTILVRRLDTELAQLAGSNQGKSSAISDNDLIKRALEGTQTLPGPMREAFRTGFANSLHTVYAWSIPFAAATFVLMLVMPSIPLRTDTELSGEEVSSPPEGNGR
ncbi:MAG: MFS transporter [Streptomyces sp.]|nr:MFS transporter [Streptomyces sp.]